jgi:hypothetical protein
MTLALRRAVSRSSWPRTAGRKGIIPRNPVNLEQLASVLKNDAFCNARLALEA